MSDREKTEVRHVTKEPKFNDLEKKKNYKEAVSKVKEMCMEEGMSLMIEERSKTNVEGTQRVK